jgi:hypothetical protein
VSAADDLPDGRKDDPVLFAQGDLGCPFGVFAADRPDFLDREFRAAVSFPFSDSRIFAGVVLIAFAVPTSALAFAIREVVALRPLKNVQRVYALFVVAGVTPEQQAKGYAVVNQVGDTVGTERLPLDCENAVAAVEKTGGPKPARPDFWQDRRPVLIDLGPEPFNVFRG